MMTPLWMTVLAMVLGPVLTFLALTKRLQFDEGRAEHQDQTDSQKNSVEIERLLNERVKAFFDIYDKQIAKYDQQITGLEKQIEALKIDHARDVEKVQAQLQETLIQLDAARHERDQLLTGVQARDKQISSLQERIASLENAPHVDSVTVKVSRQPVLSEMSLPVD